MHTIAPIAHFKSPFKEKFGIPRQAGLVEELEGEIVFEAEYSSPDALKGLEGFDYVWLIWGFDRNKASEHFQATVRPPRLGGNDNIGVFASRSPFRPNGLGLSSVKIAKISEGRITVKGADLADGTPIYDIKPYVTYADSHPEARSGFVDKSGWASLEVVLPEDIEDYFKESDIPALKKVLSLDPRPRYQDDPDKEYGMAFAGKDVHFKVAGSILTVTKIIR